MYIVWKANRECSPICEPEKIHKFKSWRRVLCVETTVTSSQAQNNLSASLWFVYIESYSRQRVHTPACTPRGNTENTDLKNWSWEWNDCTSDCLFVSEPLIHTHTHTHTHIHTPVLIPLFSFPNLACLAAFYECSETEPESSKDQECVCVCVFVRVAWVCVCVCVCACITASMHSNMFVSSCFGRVCFCRKWMIVLWGEGWWSTKVCLPPLCVCLKPPEILELSGI